MKNVTTRHLRLFGSLNQTKLTPDSVQWASLMFSTATQIFKELYLLEQVKRIELSPTAWQAVVLTVILHLHFEALFCKNALLKVSGSPTTRGSTVRWSVVYYDRRTVILYTSEYTPL